MLEFLKRLFGKSKPEATECPRVVMVRQALLDRVFLTPWTAQHVDGCKICKQTYRSTLTEMYSTTD